MDLCGVRVIRNGDGGVVYTLPDDFVYFASQSSGDLRGLWLVVHHSLRVPLLVWDGIRSLYERNESDSEKCHQNFLEKSCSKYLTQMQPVLGFDCGQPYCVVFTAEMILRIHISQNLERRSDAWTYRTKHAAKINYDNFDRSTDCSSLL